MRRVLIIVARDQLDLHGYFKRGFEGVEGVEVVLDRRVHVGGSLHGHGLEADRRRDIEAYEELQLRGFIIRAAR